MKKNGVSRKETYPATLTQREGPNCLPKLLKLLFLDPYHNGELKTWKIYISFVYILSEKFSSIIYGVSRFRSLSSTDIREVRRRLKKPNNRKDRMKLNIWKTLQIDGVPTEQVRKRVNEEESGVMEWSFKDFRIFVYSCYFTEKHRVTGKLSVTHSDPCFSPPFCPSLPSSPFP